MYSYIFCNEKNINQTHLYVNLCMPFHHARFIYLFAHLRTYGLLIKTGTQFNNNLNILNLNIARQHITTTFVSHVLPTSLFHSLIALIQNRHPTPAIMIDTNDVHIKIWVSSQSSQGNQQFPTMMKTNSYPISART